MSAVFRRTFFAFVLALVLLTTGAWQSHQVALAQSLPDIPLFPGLTWSSLGASARDIRINTNGDSISLSGESYVASEQFASELSQDVRNYYSNAQLAQAGWESYDSFKASDGFHYVFSHPSGVYLSVEFLYCSKDPTSICITVWQGAQTQPTAKATTDNVSGTQAVAAATTFGKTSPSNGATGLNPTSTTLSWEAYPNADKYKYCVHVDKACSDTDTAWTSTYDRSVTVTDLAYNTTYYWQVKATTCETCVPKVWVYANNDTPWKFYTKSGGQVTILGNAGVAAATLSYVNGTAKSVKSDSSGAYSISLPLNWTGTITPSKTGYIFTPASASFSNLTATQTIQNFTATAIYVISGNAGLAGVTLSYTNGTPQTVVSDASGNYSISVPYGWSGTVTPSKIGYVFTPANRTYANLAGNQTGQNYTPSVAVFTISGNAGTAGVTLSYTGGTILSDGNGNYLITVPYGWTGTVTPIKTDYLFSPTQRTYSSPITANQTNQNFTATALYTISGNVGVGGATLSYTDGTPKTVTSQVNGSYSFKVPGNWSGTVTPDQPCFTFNPTSRTYTSVAANQPSQNYTPSFKSGSGCADVDVKVGGASQGRFGVSAHGSLRASFVAVNNGPVEITSSNAVSLMGAERVIYKANGVNTSFSEMMGLPNSQLDTVYWLPWYNDADMDTQLRFANVTNSQASVRVFIAGAEMNGSPFTLNAGQSIRVSFPGINNGPVEIQSNVNIVASERALYSANGTPASFTEMMALPNSQIDNTYWLPWYNNVDLDTQLRFANVTTNQTATVHLYVNGQEMTSGCTPSSSPYTLAGGESLRVSCPGVNNGPVQIKSDQNIVAAERVIYKVNNVNTSYSEMMALPNSQLTTTYWLPWYNNTDLDTQLRFANVTTNQNTVHVYVGNVEVNGSPFVLNAGQSTRISFANVNNGPVKIVSNQNVVAALRVIYKVNGVNTSFSELMALPNSLLDIHYWLPWYNNADLDTQLRFGIP